MKPLGIPSTFFTPVQKIFVLGIIIKQNNILYEEISLDDDDMRLEFYNTMKELGFNINSVPQIYIDDNYIGGYDELCVSITPIYHYDKLHEVAKIITENLNKIIDINFWINPRTWSAHIVSIITKSQIRFCTS